MRLRSITVAMTALLGLVGGVTATHADSGGLGPGVPTMLALGDSYPFGRPATVGFVGYPELVGALTGLAVTNLSCPGETSGSLMSLTSPQDGCRSYREHHPLRVDYEGSQLDAAVAYLRANRNTQLVTLDVGGNDFLFVLDACDQAHPGNPAAVSACFYAALPAALKTLGGNLKATIHRLRVDGDYRGTIVLKNVTVTDYSDSASVAVADLANEVIAKVAKTSGAELADAASPWRSLAEQHEGDACAARLLYVIAVATCDDHPSQFGHTVLAAVILSSVLVTT